MCGRIPKSGRVEFVNAKGHRLTQMNTDKATEINQCSFRSSVLICVILWPIPPSPRRYGATCPPPPRPNAPGPAWSWPVKPSQTIPAGRLQDAVCSLKIKCYGSVTPLFRFLLRVKRLAISHVTGVTGPTTFHSSHQPPDTPNCIRAYFNRLNVACRISQSFLPATFWRASALTFASSLFLVGRSFL